jgi:CheY-like chemotaxis protein
LTCPRCKRLAAKTSAIAAPASTQAKSPLLGRLNDPRLVYSAPPAEPIRSTFGRSDLDGSSPLDNLSVLVIEDDESMRTLIGRMLSRLNVRVVVKEDGPTGLQALEHPDHPVDLIICDWNMPGMSGMEVFERVHALHPQLPFLMLTGRADLESVVAAKKAGIAGYIVKPISLQELKTKLSFLARKSA